VLLLHAAVIVNAAIVNQRDIVMKPSRPRSGEKRSSRGLPRELRRKSIMD
jgi:hypothetical protein